MALKISRREAIGLLGVGAGLSSVWKATLSGAARVPADGIALQAGPAFERGAIIRSC